MKLPEAKMPGVLHCVAELSGMVNRGQQEYQLH